VGLAGSGGAGEGARWRVFLSHTSELENYPRGTSYVAAAKEAISAAGHVVVDMSGFPARDQTPARMCAEKVHDCDVYLGLFGTRFGSPVRDRPEVSYTELEFDTATETGKDRLVFLLDTDAEEVNIPPAALIDREFGERQEAFRRRVRASGLTTRSFASPAGLQLLVERSLRDLADTRARLASGIQREQVPAEPQPVRVSKFVNPPPAAVPAWFAGRHVETRLLARYVADPGIALVTVSGRPGIGKTALVCRLLKGLEAGLIPGAGGSSPAIAVGGIVYLSHNGLHQVDYPTLVADLLRLLPAEEAQRLRHIYRDPHRGPAEVMLAVLEAFPARDPVVVLLDNLESVMDTEREILTDPALREALSAVLTAPAHAITVITTTRVTPGDLVKVEPGRQHLLRLNEGLGSPDAQNVLRELDDDGRLGLRDAPGELLDGLGRHTRGFPRALEAVKAILVGDATLTPHDLLDRTRRLPEDRVVQVLVGEAYELLDAPAQRVMQALAVFPAPVSAVGVDFLLQSADPTTDAAPILTRLVRRQLAQFQDGHYSLHPVDREYARGQLPPDSPADFPATFTLTALQVRAANYYARIRTPRESWHTLEDIRPQLAEFELRCETGDYDAAGAVLEDIDFYYLQAWGHYHVLIGLHGRIHGRITDPGLECTHLIDFGNCHYALGEYEAAIDLFTQQVALSRKIGDRQREGRGLGSVGRSHATLGDYRRAIDLCTRALAIARETGDRWGECTRIGNLASCYSSLGEYQRAIDLHTQALNVSRDCGHRLVEGNTLCFLGSCHYSLGELRRAAELHTQALAIAREIGYRYCEAYALGYLGLIYLADGDTRKAMMLLDQAVSIADTTGEIVPAVNARSTLALAHLQLSHPVAALAAVGQKPYWGEQPIIRLMEGLALLGMALPEESGRAFRDAVAAADTRLALADANVEALQVQALALSGLAVVTADPIRATEANEAFGRLRAVTSAAGVFADTRRLLDQIIRHDRDGILAEVRVD
jgi:tetratricopeptide (TPR) repeat protein